MTVTQTKTKTTSVTIAVQHSPSIRAAKQLAGARLSANTAVKSTASLTVKIMQAARKTMAKHQQPICQTVIQAISTASAAKKCFPKEKLSLS